MCDPATLRCLRVNDAACAHYGYSHDEFLGLTLLDLLPDSGRRTLTTQFPTPSIVDDVRAALALSGLDPGRLVLEITESIIMDDTEATISRFEALKALGVRVSIDDFATGYSSLSYLRRFRFDVLKIDKSFVDGMAVRPEQSSAFIRTIVTLGHTLGMEVTTEGIETAEQYRELVRLGSDSGQGFLMSRPLDPGAVVGFLRRATPDYAMA